MFFKVFHYHYNFTKNAWIFTKSHYSVIILSYFCDEDWSYYTNWQINNLSFKTMCTQISQIECPLNILFILFCSIVWIPWSWCGKAEVIKKTKRSETVIIKMMQDPLPTYQGTIPIDAFFYGSIAYCILNQLLTHLDLWWYPLA